MGYFIGLSWALLVCIITSRALLLQVTERLMSSIVILATADHTMCVLILPLIKKKITRNNHFPFFPPNMAASISAWLRSRNSSSHIAWQYASANSLSFIRSGFAPRFDRIRAFIIISSEDSSPSRLMVNASISFLSRQSHPCSVRPSGQPPPSSCRRRSESPCRRLPSSS